MPKYTCVGSVNMRPIGSTIELTKEEAQPLLELGRIKPKEKGDGADPGAAGSETGGKGSAPT